MLFPDEYALFSRDKNIANLSQTTLGSASSHQISNTYSRNYITVQ